MQKSSGRTWLGLILVIFGGLLIFDNLSFIHFNLFSWPVILIAIGVIMLVNSDKTNSGFILIVIGGLFLLAKIFNFSVGDLIADFWPIALILVGLSLLVKKRDGSYSSPFQHNNCRQNQNYEDEVNETIDETSVFSDRKLRVTSQNFKGGKLTAVFGAAELDLFNANLASGNNILDIVALFGGITIYIPNDWNVHLKVTSIFGAFEDKRRKAPDAVPNPDKTLVIQGTVIFGGGEIKS